MSQNVERLLNDIEHGTREEIWEAAKVIASLPGDQYVPSLILVLESAEQPEARAAACYALGFGRHKVARPKLEAVVSNCAENTSVRGHAAEALGYIGDKASVHVLVGVLEDENADPGVRYWCIFALGQIGDPTAKPALSRAADALAEMFYGKYSLRSEALDALSEIELRFKDDPA